MSLANRARAEQHATRAAFFIPGFATAAWAPMVPYAKAKAGLSDASLGAVLLCLGLGSLLAMPLAGALTGRLGCRRVMVITCAMMLCALPWPGAGRFGRWRLARPCSCSAPASVHWIVR